MKQPKDSSVIVTFCSSYTTGSTGPTDERRTYSIPKKTYEKNLGNFKKLTKVTYTSQESATMNLIHELEKQDNRVKPINPADGSAAHMRIFHDNAGMVYSWYAAASGKNRYMTVHRIKHIFDEKGMRVPANQTLPSEEHFYTTTGAATRNKDDVHCICRGDDKSNIITRVEDEHERELSLKRYKKNVDLTKYRKPRLPKADANIPHVVVVAGSAYKY